MQILEMALLGSAFCSRAQEQGCSPRCRQPQFCQFFKSASPASCEMPPWRGDSEQELSALPVSAARLCCSLENGLNPGECPNHCSSPLWGEILVQVLLTQCLLLALINSHSHTAKQCQQKRFRDVSPNTSFTSWIVYTVRYFTLWVLIFFSKCYSVHFQSTCSPFFSIKKILFFFFN